MSGERKHTPLHAGPDCGYGQLNGCQIRDAQGYVIAVTIGDVPELDAASCAEFIVRACNSHYPLLEALEEARTQIICLQERLGITDTGSGTLSIIDAAISKATGQPTTTEPASNENVLP